MCERGCAIDKQGCYVCSRNFITRKLRKWFLSAQCVRLMRLSSFKERAGRRSAGRRAASANEWKILASKKGAIADVFADAGLFYYSWNMG